MGCATFREVESTSHGDAIDAYGAKQQFKTGDPEDHLIVACCRNCCGARNRDIYSRRLAVM
jgi:hypothetical protein